MHELAYVVAINEINIVASREISFDESVSAVY